MKKKPARNNWISALHNIGMTKAELAYDFGVTRQRVDEIVEDYPPMHWQEAFYRYVTSDELESIEEKMHGDKRRDDIRVRQEIFLSRAAARATRKIRGTTL